MQATIYHNPRCSKSRQTLALLQENGIEPDVIEYLNAPPDTATLKNLLQQLDKKPLELMRTGEAEYKEARDAVTQMDEGEQIAWMTANPKVIERPIVVTTKGARVGRPPETVLEII
jgi:arsenate reductase